MLTKPVKAMLLGSYPQTDGLLFSRVCVSKSMEYKKPFKTIQEQIRLLRERGLIIDDAAEHYLRHLNYYRLSGYWLPLEENHDEHLFRKGAHFDDVLNLYFFDRELRLLLLDSIERIEVSVRTHWAHYCAKKYGSHAYTDKSISKKESWYQKNLDILKKEIIRSKEIFINHYQNTYDSPEEPPIWVVCEVMSLGLLSRYLKNIKPSEICSEIAKSFQLDFSTLTSFIEQLTYLRNLCAHHGRVWNRKFTKTMKLPKTKPTQLISSFNIDPNQERKIYNTLVMPLHFLNITSP